MKLNILYNNLDLIIHIDEYELSGDDLDIEYIFGWIEVIINNKIIKRMIENQFKDSGLFYIICGDKYYNHILEILIDDHKKMIEELKLEAQITNYEIDRYAEQTN